MRIFILEDNQMRINTFKDWYGSDHELTIVTNAQEAIVLLALSSNYDIFFLDHDLGDRVFVDVQDPNTGSTVAKFLESLEVTGKIIIHSWNIGGARYMMNHLPKAIYEPFNPLQKYPLEMV